MRKLKIVALSSLVLLTFVALTAGGAAACDGKGKAATAQSASADCMKSADVQTAGAKMAGHECTAACSASCAATCSGMAKGAAMKTAQAIRIETVRMPSGALAVFYHGKNAEMVKSLQDGATMGAMKFGCPMAAQVASSESCNTEMAPTSDGALMIVTSSDTTALDQYEKQYAVAIAASSEMDGE